MSLQEVSYSNLLRIPTKCIRATEMMYYPSQNWILFRTNGVITKYDLKKVKDKYSAINVTKFTNVSIASTVNVEKGQVFFISNRHCHGPGTCRGRRFNHSSAVISLLDLKKQKIKVFSRKERHFTGRVQCLYLPLPINEIHVFSANMHGRVTHFVFCEQKQKLDVVSVMTTASKPFIMKKILFTQSQQKLIALVSNFKTSEMQLWSAQISDKSYHWEKQAVSFPTGREKVINFKAINVFDSIIVIFYCGNRYKKEMWCLDLKNTKYEWIKSEKTFPNEYSNIHALTNVDNNIHFAYGANHFVIKAADILPKSLRIKYMKMYEHLVNGYHKNGRVNPSFNANLPIVLNKLIASYYCNIFNFN